MGLTSCSILIDCDHWVFHNFGPIDLFSLYLLFLDAGHVITGLRTIKNSFLQISSYSIRCICTQNLWKVKGVHFLTPSLRKQNTQAKELYFGIELLLHCWLFKWRHFVTWTITNIAWSGLGALNSTTASGELYFKAGGGGRGYDVIMLMAYLIVCQFWPIKRSQTIWLTIYQWKKCKCAREKTVGGKNGAKVWNSHSFWRISILSGCVINKRGQRKNDNRTTDNSYNIYC